MLGNPLHYLDGPATVLGNLLDDGFGESLPYKLPHLSDNELDDLKGV